MIAKVCRCRRPVDHMVGIDRHPGWCLRERIGQHFADIGIHRQHGVGVLKAG